jgi:pantetheine-phosphate adenylyltransferase
MRASPNGERRINFANKVAEKLAHPRHLLQNKEHLQSPGEKMASDLRIAVYTGVFDPVHFGHMDVVRRGSRLVDRLVVGVGENLEKLPLFNQAERVDLLQKVVGHLSNVEVTPFQGLAVHFVRSLGARVMLRGIRTTSDMEYEFTMSLTNAALDPEIDTIFLMAKETYSHISSSLLRQIAAFGGELDSFVPPLVRDALLTRARERHRKQLE